MDGVKQQDSTPQNDSTLGFEFSHSNRTTAFSHDQVDRIFPVLKITTVES
jgi:hypothetical protein